MTFYCIFYIHTIPYEVVIATVFAFPLYNIDRIAARLSYEQDPAANRAVSNHVSALN